VQNLLEKLVYTGRGTFSPGYLKSGIILGGIMKRLKPRAGIRIPSHEEIYQLAAMEYMDLNEEEVNEIKEASIGVLSMIERLDEIPAPRVELKYLERDRGYRPTPEEDPLNIFITKCLVKGAPTGKLAGKRVGLKDNICLAGVPMTNASRLSEGFIPDIDATVVTRLLNEGAVIVGKLNMDDFSLFGTSETSAFGCVRNPRNPDYSPGGSSSGSGAAVANNDVDIALGVDQGGSGRIPAAWCGIVSIKPTHGLVPSFGIVYMDHTIDYICPMAKTVEEVALTLEVIAGEDPNDPQWVRGPIRVEKYTEALGADISGIRIGIVKEAFQWDSSEEEVNQAVWKAIRHLEELGTNAQELSLPLIKDGWAIEMSILSQAITNMVESDQEGCSHGGNYNLSWNEAYGKFRRARANEFPPLIKLLLVLGKYLRREYYSKYYVKAQILRRMLRDEINKALETVDVLLMPTVPMRPLKLKEDKMGIKEFAERLGDLPNNTCPFNLSGHPAITIPCGPPDSLPIGLQLASKHFTESLLFRIAHVFEQRVIIK
jgi:amidase